MTRLSPRLTTRLRAGVAALAAAAVLATTACSAPAQGTANAVEPVDGFTLSDTIATARVVGVGETTHDGRQTVELRLAVLRQLVERHGFRAFALEDQFGSVTNVDAYVMGGPGTAEQVVRDNLFRIYRTRQYVELIAWIRQHNDSVPPAERVRVIGVDPRGCGSSAKVAGAYLAEVDPARAEAVAKAMEGCTDNNEATLPKERQRQISAALAPHVAWIRERHEDDPARAARLVVARRALEAMQQAGDLGAAANFLPTREPMLADGVLWAADQVPGHGIVYAAHNGHVDKGGAAYAHPGAGKLLHQRLGDAYRTIGTDFGTTAVHASPSDPTLVEVRRTSNLSGLVGGGSGYVDLHRAAADPSNRKLLEGKVRMGSVGTPFASWQAAVESLRSVEQVPLRDYDAVVVYARLDPSDRL